MHSYTLQTHRPSGEVYLLEYDEQNTIVAAVPNVNADLAETLHAIESGDMPGTLDEEWHENAAWAQQQRWGYPLDADDVAALGRE